MVPARRQPLGLIDFELDKLLSDIAKGQISPRYAQFFERLHGARVTEVLQKMNKQGGE